MQDCQYPLNIKSHCSQKSSRWWGCCRHTSLLSSLLVTGCSQLNKGGLSIQSWGLWCLTPDWRRCGLLFLWNVLGYMLPWLPTNRQLFRLYAASSLIPLPRPFGWGDFIVFVITLSTHLLMYNVAVHTYSSRLIGGSIFKHERSCAVEKILESWCRFHLFTF